MKLKYFEPLEETAITYSVVSGWSTSHETTQRREPAAFGGFNSGTPLVYVCMYYVDFLSTIRINKNYINGVTSLI